MKKVYIVRPKCDKKCVNEQQLTTDMEVVAETYLNNPFINGAEEVQEQYKRLYHFDYNEAGCSEEDFIFEKKIYCWYWICENLKHSFGSHLFAAICFLLVFAIAYLLKLFGVLESFQQFVVVVLSAAATYVIVCVTMNSQSKHQAKMQQQLASKQSELQQALIQKQSENEAAKDKDIKIFEKKVETYSDFIRLMWNDATETVDLKQWELLRNQIFNKLIFYLEDDSLSKLIDLMEKIAKEEIKTIKAYSEITNLLKADIGKKNDVSAKISDLWSVIEIPSDQDTISEGTNKPEIHISSNTFSENAPLSNNCQFWHFAMLGADEQIKALREGTNELNLVEYNEEWRTNLIKQVQENDLIFLFRSGGWGYMGVYRAIGWRVFEFGDNEECKETIHLFGKAETPIIDKDQQKRDIEMYDIYYSKGDGASLCSSIIVEPLAFARNGIGNPGGVYRRTISRYYHEYGMKQLARFMAIMDNENEFNVHYNGETTIEMGCNIELFKKILASYKIKPAERDQNGNWLI